MTQPRDQGEVDQPRSGSSRNGPCGCLKDKNGIWCKVTPISLGQVAEEWGNQAERS